MDDPVFRLAGISYLHIPATDPQLSAAFYHQVFGWQIGGRPERPGFVDGTGHVIGAWQTDLAVAGDAGMLPYVYVASVADTLKMAVALGGAIVKEPYPEGNLTVATLRDPAGNVIGVWQQTPTGSGEGHDLLREARSILVVDWPSRDVPETLARAGYVVTVKGGPEPDSYAVFEIEGAELARRPIGRAPDNVDLVYCHRPIEELPALARLASELGARALWLQSGQTAEGAKDARGCWLPEQRVREARDIAAACGLMLIYDLYIADAVRDLRDRPT